MILNHKFDNNINHLNMRAILFFCIVLILIHDRCPLYATVGARVEGESRLAEVVQMAGPDPKNIKRFSKKKSDFSEKNIFRKKIRYFEEKIIFEATFKKSPTASLKGPRSRYLLKFSAPGTKIWFPKLGRQATCPSCPRSCPPVNGNPPFYIENQAFP